MLFLIYGLLLLSVVIACFLALRCLSGPVLVGVAMLITLLVSGAHAHTLKNCTVLLDDSSHNASENGEVTLFPLYNDKAFSGIAYGTPSSGTTPTLDIKIQTCRTKSSSSCVDFLTFDQCTTGTCYGTDNFQGIDAPVGANWWKYFRAVTTLGGTTPAYTGVKVEICYQ